MATETIALIVEARKKGDATFKETNRFLDGLGSKAKAAGKLTAAGMGIAASGIGLVGAAAFKLASDATAVDTASRTFDRLASSIGESSDAMLGNLRQATQGMVSDFDLMQSSNKLMSMGLASSAEEAAKLTEMASVLGQAMGTDAKQSMEDFALMLANQSIPRLDTFGISSGQVRARIEELQAQTEGLSREQAFMQAVMEQGEVSMTKLEGSVGRADKAQAQFSATIANVKDSLGVALQPALAIVMESFTAFATEHGPPLADFLATALPAAIQTASDFWTGTLQPALDMVVAFIKDPVMPTIEFLRDLFTSSHDEMGGSADSTWGKIKGIIDTTAQLVKAIIETTFGAILSFWQTHHDTIMSIARTIWDAYKIYIDTILDVIQGIINAALALIRGDWSTAWDEIKGVAQAAWEGIEEIIRLAGPVIIDIVKGIVRNVRAKFTEVDWGAVGRSIIDGIKDGIRGAAGALADAAKAAAQGALDAVKRLIGASSPARAWADEVGKPMMLGVALGVAEWTRIAVDAVTNAIGSLVQIAQETMPAIVEVATESLRQWADNLHQWGDNQATVLEVASDNWRQWADNVASATEVATEAMRRWTDTAGAPAGELATEAIADVPGWMKVDFYRRTGQVWGPGGAPPPGQTTSQTAMTLNLNVRGDTPIARDNARLVADELNRMWGNQMRVRTRVGIRG